jgi:hypothetical protein
VTLLIREFPLTFRDGPASFPERLPPTVPYVRTAADVLSTNDVKTFKLKARGDTGAGKTQLLVAFAALLRGVRNVR